MNRLLLALMVTLLPIGRASATVSTTHANDEGLWKDSSLVYLHINAVTNTGPIDYRIVARPIATLAGRFDCGASEEVVLRMQAGYMGSPIRTPPSAGDRVLMLIYEVDPENSYAASLGRFYVPGNYVTFMPGNNVRIRVTSIEDPVVGEIMQKIREGRLQSNPEQEFRFYALRQIADSSDQSADWRWGAIQQMTTLKSTNATTYLLENISLRIPRGSDVAGNDPFKDFPCLDVLTKKGAVVVPRVLEFLHEKRSASDLDMTAELLHRVLGDDEAKQTLEREKQRNPRSPDLLGNLNHVLSALPGGRR